MSLRERLVRVPSPSHDLYLLRDLAIAVVAVVAFTGVKYGADRLFGPGTPWLIYLGAVLAAAGCGGLAAGLLTTFLSVVICDLTFVSTETTPHGHTSRDWIRLSLFLVEGICVSWLIGSLQRAHAEMVKVYDSTIEGWTRLLDLRDHATEGHSRRVTELTVRVGRALGLPEAELTHLRRGALLHDIGKIAVPDAILGKPGPLTNSERAVMQQHPRLAYQCLSSVEFLAPSLDIPYCHHEKWDGSGYPQGLFGEEIPLSARIFAAVDIWDALTSDRPYRNAWSHEQARDHLLSLSGTHLDPRVVKVFLSAVATEPCVATASQSTPSNSAIAR